MRRLAILLLALASVGGASPWAPDRPGPDFDILDYQVALTLNPDDDSVQGEEQVTLVSLRGGLDEVVFTGNALSVLPAGGAAATTTRIGNDWVIRLKRPLAKAAKATLALRFSGKPARGLTFGPHRIHTDYFACDWMICAQDRPGDKATLSLTLDVPETGYVFAVGEQVGQPERREGRLVSHWRLDKPYSSYLYGFAAGPFDAVCPSLERPRLCLFSDDDTAIDQDYAAALADTPRMVAFFQEKAGIGLPTNSYSQLVVAGSAAQESATYSTLGWDTLSAVLKDPQEDWLPAHELAHQWWGNLVTCASWDDFWLNEGVTSFMVAAWKQHRWGQAAYDREMALFRTRVDKARAAGVDVPLTFHGPYPSLGLKRAIVYGKGALFMDALRTEMGEDAFWAGLKRYTRQYAGGAADSHDFQQAMQAETRKDLGPLFRAWVY